MLHRKEFASKRARNSVPPWGSRSSSKFTTMVRQDPDSTKDSWNLISSPDNSPRKKLSGPEIITPLRSQKISRTRQRPDNCWGLVPTFLFLHRFLWFLFQVALPEVSSLSGPRHGLALRSSPKILGGYSVYVLATIFLCLLFRFFSSYQLNGFPSISFCYNGVPAEFFLCPSLYKCRLGFALIIIVCIRPFFYYSIYNGYAFSFPNV